MERYIARSSTSYVPRLTRAFAQKAESKNGDHYLLILKDFN